MTRLARAVVIAVIAARSISQELGAERLSRRIEWQIGAPMTGIDGLDQDAQGFLWLATAQGLVRYDGVEMRVVAPDVHFIIPGCARTGRLRVIQARADDAEILELAGADFVAVSSPAGAGTGEPTSAACSDDGMLWLVVGGELWRRDATGTWTEVTRPPDATEWGGIWPGPLGSVLVTAGRAVYRVAPDGRAELLARLHRVMSCYLRDDGTLIALDWRTDGGHLVRARDGKVDDLAFRAMRPMAVLERRGTIWASFDSILLGVRSDGSETEVRPSPSGMVGGGPLLVDRENTLWVATARGLVQFPEPDTAGIDPDLGAGRWLHRLGNDLYMSTWAGAHRIAEIDRSWHPTGYVSSIGAVCRDARDRTWAVDFESLSRIDPDGRVTKIPFEHVGSLGPCTLDPSGTLWMPTLRGLLRLERDADRPVVEPLPAGDERGDGAVGSVLLDRRGRLWVGGFARVCRTDDPRAGLRAWRCESLHTGAFVSDLMETDDARMWGASEGVYERAEDGTWARLTLASSEIGTPAVTGLSASPRGGIWLAGRGAILRVDGTSHQGRMTILEHIGAWHGVPSSNTFDILEMEDGTIWLIVETTLVRLPASVRTFPDAPPRVAITGLRVGGDPRPVDVEFRSAYAQNRLEARVSAFSYRDPSLLRYRFRMNDDEPWSPPTSNPVFQFYNVSSGRYALSFAASLDGEHWTQTETPLRFRIDPPWFRQSWFIALTIAAAAAVGWGLHRARVARLIALERQRTHIAMDLHDAIGSGLGSIGLLAGLGSRHATDPEKRREISHQIATIASELGLSLSEIVWSLRLGSDSLEALAQYLKERANKLFVDDDVRFRTEFPSHWPDASLSLTLRRNLLLIALEALHNAARHAEASEVRLGMTPAGSSWSLWVEDDGVGIDRGVRPGSGMGLENMKRRGDEIGAKITWTPVSPNGTRVTVVFDPRSA